jgi:hypothetical protein
MIHEKHCALCGQSPASETDEYCRVCGGRIVEDCPNCGKPVLCPIAKHCPVCGHKMVRPQVPSMSSRQPDLGLPGGKAEQRS